MNKNAKIKILVLIFVVIIIATYAYLSFFQPKRETPQIYYSVQITCYGDKNQTYQVYLPVPITYNGSLLFNMSDYQIEGHINRIGVVETIHGTALMLNGTGDTAYVVESVSLEDYERSEHSRLSMWENFSSDRDYIVGKVWIKVEGSNKSDLRVNLIYGHKGIFKGKNIVEFVVLENLYLGWNTYEVQKRLPPVPCSASILLVTNTKREFMLLHNSEMDMDSISYKGGCENERLGRP